MNMACADVLVDLGVYTPFGRQYIKWHPSCGDVERKERYQLTHMPASGRDDECSDQELYVNDCTVIWSAGGSVKQCYTGECRVREAVWTLMKYETAQIPETTLAVLRTESVDFTALSGRTYTMPLTRSVAHLHPTHPDGFLLELDARERLDTLNDCGLRYGTHPWAPAQPVVLRTPKGTPYQVSRLSCLYSEVSNDLVVCYETSKCTLTLWKAQVSGDPIPKKTEEATDFSKASSRELDSSRSYTGAFADDVMNMARVEQADTLVNDRGGLLVMTLQHSISMGTASSAAYANMKNWTIFACHDCVGQPVSLWMIHRPSSSGCVLDLKGGSTPARTIVAIDDATRISFKSTENCLDDEVLGLQDGKLQLHASNGERILQCRTEHILPTSLPSQVARPAIVGLRDGVGNRVTLCLSNNSMLRVAVSECAKSPIVRCLMRLLQVNLPTRQQPLQVQHDTLNNPPIPQTFLRLRRCYLLSYTPAREWDALVRAVYCLINNGDESECTCGPNQLGGADANEKGLQNPVVKPSEPVSAWEYLCKTHKPANTGLGIPTVQDGLVKSSRRPAHEVTHRSSSHQHWQVVERVFKLLDVCAACMSIDVRFVTCVHRLNGLVDDMLAQLINVQSQSYTRVPTHTDTDPERQVHALKQAKIEVQTRLRRIDMLGWLESKVTRMRSTAHARTADYASAENTLLFPDGLLDIESQKLPSVIQTALAVAELYEFIGQNPNSSTTRVISGVSPQQSTDTDVSLRVGAYAPDHSQVHSAKGTQNRSSSRAFSDMGVDPTGDGTFAGPSSDTVSPTVGLSIRDQRQLVQLLTRRSSRLCLDNLSFGVALPLRECLAAVREHSDPDLDPHACRLVGRGDLIQNKAPIQHPLSGLACLPDEESNGSSPNGVWRYCFTEDRRFLDALAMLQSSGTIYVMVPADRSTAEYDANLEKQTVLLAKLEQSLSRSVGRGMALYGSSRPLLTEPLRVPPITTKGQDYQTRATLTLDPSVFPFVAPPDALPTTTGTTTDISGFTAWPEFHNGAAAGLEIAVKDGISNINSAWIAYNKPLTSKKSLPNQNGESDEKSVTENTYAGFLLALGLQGHLSHLSPAALYGFLRGRNTTTSVAIVLGMAATCRGTQDATVTGLLAMFVPALLPARSAELEAPEAVRTSAVLGLGLLYQGTAQRQMCKTLLREIGKGPGSTSNGASSGYDTRSVSNDEIKNAPSYSLACGLALGMCALGMGDSYQSVHALGDLNLPDELRRYMLGGKLRPSEIKEDKDYRIKEGERINTDITAHAATLALGLIYLKTGNRSISSRLDVPTTFHQLEYVRADLLLLRVLSRSLILWEEIEATSQWVTSQIPSVVTDLLNAAPKDRAKFLGPRGYNSAEARLPIARQVWMYMITGSCFAIGLKFAGSADADAQRVLRLYAIHVLSARPADFDQSPNILTSCALVCLNALCMVMAGTGDLPTMRLILRFKKEMHRSYGSSMSLNMGLGLLFVGSGMCSLSTSNEAIAALICSFYPMFPENPTDNRYHLQAFRHLFVLALESRTVIPRETDGGAAVSVPLIITMRNGCTRKVVAPCVLPELMYMKMISVDSPRYHPIHIPVTPDTRLTRLCALVVQRRTGFLPYRDDPNGIRRLAESVMFTSFNHRDHRASHPKLLETSQRAQLMRMVRAYTLDATLLAYAETLLGRAEENESFIAILSECLASGTPELLSSYLAINHTLKMARTTPCIHSLQNLRLARAFYAHRRICEKPPLMLQSYLDYVHQQVSSALISPSPNLDSEIVQSLRSVYFFGGAVGPNKDVQAIRDAYAHHTEQLPPISAMSRLATEFSSLSPDTLLSVMDSVTGVPIL